MTAERFSAIDVAEFLDHVPETPVAEWEQDGPDVFLTLTNGQVFRIEVFEARDPFTGEPEASDAWAGGHLSVDPGDPPGVSK